MIFLIFAIIIILFAVFYMAGERVVKTAIKSDRIFLPFDDSIHQKQSQQIRIQHSLEENMKIKTLLSNGYSGKIIGATGNMYLTTLKNCTCQDFKKNNQPCKHMYFLIIQTGRGNIYKEDNTYKIEKMKSVESRERRKETKDKESLEKSITQTNESSEVSFNDSMSYMLFGGDGVYSATGRKQKFSIEAFSESEAIDMLFAKYIPETINIQRIPFDPPSDTQLQVMHEHKNKIPSNACKIDVSFLMNKIIGGQGDPDNELIQFASTKKVKFSYLCGEISLYDCIWECFNITEKIAFYILCVKKDKTGAWDFNSWDFFNKKAAFYVADEKFMNSFKRYLKSGFYGFRGDVTSRNTNCYKTVISDI